MSKLLNEKQKLFCEEYIKDFNAKQAAIRAGYSPKTAEQQASRLLRDVKVQVYIQELIQKATKRNDITVDRVLQELASIAFLDVAEFYKTDGTMKNIHDIEETARRAIHSLSVKEETGMTVEDGELKPQFFEVKNLKAADKLKALELLGRYLSMFKDKLELTVDEQVQDWLRKK